jgi:hypothetical protein
MNGGTVTGLPAGANHVKSAIATTATAMTNTPSATNGR